MLDPKCLRQTITATAQRLSTRGYELNVNLISTLETKRKELQKKTQSLQNQRNLLSKSIGIAKAKQESTTTLLKKVNLISEQLTCDETALHALQEQLEAIYLTIPNLPDNTVPVGKSEENNQEVRRSNEPKVFDFSVKDHIDLGIMHQGIDFNAATKITGARFTVLYGQFARLHRALIQFMMDTHTKQHGYQEVYMPYIVNSKSLYGTGQLPNFMEDLFTMKSDPSFHLIPTAEVPVTNLAREITFHASELPKKFVCHTPCFRREAGSYGKDTRGMLRQHQFEKVELVQFCKPEHSYQQLEILTNEAESILQKLNLPYRIVSLCSGDLGFSAAKTYDIEVWLPSQKNYREVSSCSNFEAFQARRLQARWKNSITNRAEWIHTINGSGLAIGRTLIALLENCQDAEGRIHIPPVLWPYLDNIQILSPSTCTSGIKTT